MINIFKKSCKNKYNGGFSLVEIAVSIGILAILIPSVLLAFVTLNQDKPKQTNHAKALALMVQAQEAVRVIKQQDFNQFLQSGLYHPKIVENTWVLQSGDEIIDDLFTRKILVQNVKRDENGNIVESSGVDDPSTKKITISVLWNTSFDDFIEETYYITRADNNDTDIFTTTTDFEEGVFVNTQITSINDGEISLVSLADGSFYTTDYTNSSEYDYDSNEIEVINGFAQLKATQSDILFTLNDTFDNELDNWTFQTYGNVSIPKVKIEKDGNPTNYASIDFKKSNNTDSYAFLTQPFNVVSNNEPGNLSFDYKIQEYQSTPNDFRVLVYLDNHNGFPTNLIWDSGTITSTSSWNLVTNLDISSHISTAGTYYLKVGAYVDFPAKKVGPFVVGFDNVLLSWNGVTSYSSDEPSITWSNEYQIEDLIEYTSFETSEILNGQNIYYQLSNNGGDDWYYHNGTSWDIATNDTDYNTQSQIDQNIGNFLIGDSSVNVKAFLKSDGDNQVQLDSVSVGYISGSLTSNGTYTSQTIDFNKQVGINRITWDSSDYNDTNILFQVATNNNNSTWNYLGPDGTAGTYYQNNMGAISLVNTLGRY